VRRAGVSSFGIGGTNAHVIVERWEGKLRAGERTTGREVIALSGRSPTTLEQMSQMVSRRLSEMREEELADAAYTLAVGRRSYQHRKAVVCSNLRQAISALETGDPERVFERFEESTDRQVIFMFPGGGSQHVRMGVELYQTQSMFREQVDACAELLKPHLNTDLREVLYPGDKQVEEAIRCLEHPAYALPALFVTEYALAMVFNEWGIKPKAMIGHSLGEYVAACLAGVFSLKDALLMVSLRGRLFRNLPGGAMLSVPLSPEDTKPFLNDQLSIAAINGPSLCLVSGPTGAIDKLQRAMTEIGAEVRRLRISAAGHSKMVEPILEEFTESIAKINLRKPLSPFISNVTGDWIKPEEATSPQYWSRHLRQTVRFAQGMEELLKDEEALFLELGPGHSLSSLARQQKEWRAGRVAITTMRHPHQEGSDEEYLLKALAQVWLSGADVDWEGVMGGRERHRVEMPACPLERERHWIDARYAPGSAPGDQYEYELREPERHQRPRVSASYVAPRNELEVSLVGTWEKLLGIQGVGVYDNFFELGGHSLLGTQMISRLREELEIELPLRALFISPTVSGLAKTIVEAQAAQEDGRILSGLLEDIRGLGQDEIQALIEEERRLVKEEANV